MKIKPIGIIYCLIFLSAGAYTTLHAQAQKTGTPSKPTIVIVHGAWGGSWAFRKVEALLREKGLQRLSPATDRSG